MTVPAAARKQYFSSISGSTGPFSWNFRTLIKADGTPNILVTKINGSNRTVLSYPADFSFTAVALGFSGGSLTLTVAGASGDALLIEGNTPIEQLVRYANEGKFSPERHEISYDQLTLIIQEMFDDVSRSIKFPAEDSSLLSSEIPPAATRALQGLMFDATGQPIVGAPSNAPVSAAMQPVVASASISAALTALGFSAFIKTLIDDTTAGAALTTLGVSAFIQTLLDDANASTALTTLGISAFIQTLLDDTTAAAARTTLGVAYPLSQISGYVPTSITGNSTTAAVTITSGQATDTTGAANIQGGGFSWAVSNGNNANGFSGGTTLPANSTIHFFAIMKSDGSSISSFASTSTTPTLPSSHTGGFYRRIFSLTTDGAGALMTINTVTEIGGGAIICFWSTIIKSIDVTNLGTSATLYSMSVPQGIKVLAFLRQGTNNNGWTIIVTSPDQTDVAPTGAFNTTPGYNVSVGVSGTQQPIATFPVLTNTSGQVRARSTAASTALCIYTDGWIDFRR